MALLPLEQATAGMQVDEDVMNLNGSLLLGKGAILTDKVIRLLKLWGIGLVNIAGQEGDLSQEDSEQLLTQDLQEQIDRELELRFRHVDREFPPIKIIIEQARIRRIFVLTHPKQGGA